MSTKRRGRARKVHALLSGLLLVGCSWPGGLPNAVTPGRTPHGVLYPDLLGPTTRPVWGRYDSAVIVAIEDYTHLDDRASARTMAAAWYRYFRDIRGVRPRRVFLLRDAEATPKSIARAIETARYRSHHRGTLWFVFIGHISSAKAGAFGELWLREGDGTSASIQRHSFPITRVLDRAAYGTHPRAVAVLDGCLESNGLANSPLSGTMTAATPPFRHIGAVDEAQFMRRSKVTQGVPWGSLSDLDRVLIDSARSRRAPSDVSIYSSGIGSGCIEQLPGTVFPALSYLMVGGLRGWADRDADGVVTSGELLAQVTMLLRAGTHDRSMPRPRPSLYGADIALARGVAEAGLSFEAMIPAGAPPVASSQLLAEPTLWTRDRMIGFDRGSFRMGCPRRGDPECERDEYPTYRVQLSGFALDPLEVTRAEFQACVDAGMCTPIDPTHCFVWTGTGFERGAGLPELMRRPTHPAVCVTWAQAVGYCAAAEKRLPTEAEWERAAAGSSRRRFPWGDVEPTCNRAHFDGCGDHTRPVGAHPEGATPEGIHDLAGNVSEWVHDWYDSGTYWRPFREDPEGSDGGAVRVVRGGSYYDGASLLRASYRYGLNPTSSFSTVGFRCAR